MKIGDVVIDRWNEESYIIEVHKRSNTVVTFSTKPGRHQPTVYKVEELRLSEDSEMTGAESFTYSTNSSSGNRDAGG